MHFIINFHKPTETAAHTRGLCDHWTNIIQRVKHAEHDGVVWRVPAVNNNNQSDKIKRKETL
jgi:hypothetical protein